MNWTNALLLFICCGCLLSILRNPVRKSPLGFLTLLFLGSLVLYFGLQFVLPETPQRIHINLIVLLTLIAVSILLLISRSLRAPYLQYPVILTFIPLLCTPIFGEMLRPVTLLSLMIMVLQLLSAGLLGILILSYFRQIEQPMRILTGYLFLVGFLFWMWFYHPDNETSLFTMMTAGQYVFESATNSADNSGSRELKWIFMHLFGGICIGFFTSSIPSLQNFLTAKENDH